MGKNISDAQNTQGVIRKQNVLSWRRNCQWTTMDSTLSVREFQVTGPATEKAQSLGSQPVGDVIYT